MNIKTIIAEKEWKKKAAPIKILRNFHCKDQLWYQDQPWCFRASKKLIICSIDQFVKKIFLYIKK